MANPTVPTDPATNSASTSSTTVEVPDVSESIVEEPGATDVTSDPDTTDPAPTDTSPPVEDTTVAVSTDPDESAIQKQAPGFDFPPADLETDPGSPNNNRNVRPADEPIIAAYLAAFEADMATFSAWPLDAQSPELLASPLTDEVLALYDQGIAERTELNQVLDISGGLTSRPYVIEDDDGDPERVIVWDCQIDATFWKDVDTGEKAPPDAYPNAGPPGVEFGWSAALVLVDGEWLVSEGGEEPRACS